MKRYLIHILLFLIIQFTYLPFKEYFSYTHVQTSIIFYLVFYLGVEVIFMIIFEVLDQTPVLKEKYKKHQEETKVGKFEILKVLIFNELVQFAVFCLLMKKFCTEENYNTNIFYSLFWQIIINLGNDFISYIGHIWMHQTENFKKIHDLHHQTLATSGFTSHYMSLPDFFLESIILIIYMALLMPFGCSPIPILQFSSFGIFNTVVVHSGYDISFFPSPESHWNHHKYYKINYSFGITDHLFGTEK